MKDHTRRVYLLPDHLVARINRFAQVTGVSSEVEAARELLEAALTSIGLPAQDTIEIRMERARKLLADAKR